MKRSEVDINKITPMMKQYLDIKENYEDVILFFRLGDFYEMFFEDGEIASRELEIALTGKNAGLDERIPMCGIPYHAANVYIDKLIEKGYKVGICEQIEDPKDAKGIVKRDVIQVITAGTIMNTDSLKENENNYIGNIVDFKHAYGISYTDISTGEFNTLLVEYNNTKVVTEILNLGIKELVVSPNVDIKIIDLLRNHFKIGVTIYDNFDENIEYRHLYDELNDVRYIKTVNHLLSYLLETQKRSLTHLQRVKIREDKNYLKMDIHTKRNLELTETTRLKQRNYSLLWLLDKTKTAMGSRKLKSWIENPLIDINEINKRYDIVEILLNEFILKEELKELLDKVYDLERLSAKVAYGNANARDLLQLKQSLSVFPDINKLLISIKFDKQIDPLSNLFNLLEKSIYENPPISLKEGYLIKDGYNSSLDELKNARKGGKDFISRLEAKEKERTGIKNLKVGFNKVFGYYIEISKGNLSLITDDLGYIRKQTLANCERFITEELKEKEDLILGAEEKIINMEYNLFNEIKDEIKKYISTLQENAKVISEIDVLVSFSTVTENNNYIRPILTNERKVEIKNNRHPVVEKVMDKEFVANDILMNEETNILLITGPNMAGKSTYMRQFAITIIMAQIGCFVPASSAIMPVFDKIFTRIGASDDLVSGESTFMVEMTEANYAIENATSNSLILFDELGRGTATYDGMALAYAIIEYIHENIKCKTLFSTHYHELTDLDEKLKNLKNIHVSAYEEDGDITFLHKIENGAVDKSYGIHVAKLAHLPISLIKRANQILNVYESENNKKEKHIQIEMPLEEPIKQENNEVIKALEEINPLDITPLDALNKLYELKEKLKEVK